MDRLERLAQLGPLGRAERELFDRVEPVLDPLERDQRPQQPRAQEPPAHRRHRAIDFVQERSRAPAVGRVDDLEVAERSRVDEETVGAGAKGDLADVGEIGLLRVAQVVDEGARGANRSWPILEAKPEQALRAQLLEQGPARRFLVERPSGGVGHASVHADLSHERCRVVETLGRNDLARLEDGELVGERLPSVRAVILGGRELSGREIEQCHAEARYVGGWRDGHEERGLPGLEVSRIGERPR